MSFKCSLVLFFVLTTASCSGGGNCFHDPDYDKDTWEIQECLDIPTTTNITTGTTKKCKIGKPYGNSCIASAIIMGCVNSGYGGINIDKQ